MPRSAQLRALTMQSLGYPFERMGDLFQNSVIKNFAKAFR